MEQSQRKLDRFGWYTEGEEVTPEEEALRLQESSKEEERTAKWLDMFGNWEVFLKKKRNTLARRVRKGVPDSVRSRAWSLITNATLKLENPPTTVAQLLEEEENPSYDIIERDLLRTFPQIGLFNDPRIINSLRNVLRAYSQFDKELSYTQGMGFLAGMCLLYMDEETAFWAFHGILTGERTLHRGFVMPPFERLDKAGEMLDIVLKNHYPDVHKHLHDRDVMFAAFLPKWFMAAFLTLDWTPQFTLRLFDRFLFYGLRSLLSFALVVFHQLKDDLVQMEIENILPLLGNPDKNPKMKDWRLLLKLWDKLWIRKKEYLKLLKAVGLPPEKLE